jgi:glutamate synthase domain-containing protein 1
MVAHNGEINTVKGNYNWMRAREGVMTLARAGRRPEEALPDQLRAASATPPPSTTALELLTMAGYPLGARRR